MPNDKIVEKFRPEQMRSLSRLPIICIYEHPEDYPTKYVARLWNLERPTPLAAVADTLEEIRATIPAGMVSITRSETDDPCIVETWI